MSVTAVPLRPVRTRHIVWLWAGLALAIALAVLLAWGGTSRAIGLSGTAEQFLAYNARQPGVEVTPSGLQYRVLEPGQGASPTAEDVVLVTYEGQLRDGTVFDQSVQPVPFPVGAVVPGFSEGLQLMNKGAKYRFWLPPEIAYGERAPSDAIPPNSLLIFDVTLVDFLPEAVVRQLQMQQMGMGGAMPPGAPGGQPAVAPPPLPGAPPQP